MARKRYTDYVGERASAYLDAHYASFLQSKKDHGAQSDNPDFTKWFDANRSLYEWVRKEAEDWDRQTQVWIAGQSRNTPRLGGASEKAFGAFFQDMIREVKRLARSREEAS